MRPDLERFRTASLAALRARLFPRRPNPAAEKVVDLAAYRAFRQELERRRRERIDGYPAPATINCRCSVRWIEPAGSTPDA